MKTLIFCLWNHIVDVYSTAWFSAVQQMYIFHSQNPRNQYLNFKNYIYEEQHKRMWQNHNR